MIFGASVSPPPGRPDCPRRQAIRARASPRTSCCASAARDRSRRRRDAAVLRRAGEDLRHPAHRTDLAEPAGDPTDPRLSVRGSAIRRLRGGLEQAARRREVGSRRCPTSTTRAGRRRPGVVPDRVSVLRSERRRNAARSSTSDPVRAARPARPARPVHRRRGPRAGESRRCSGQRPGHRTGRADALDASGPRRPAAVRSRRTPTRPPTWPRSGTTRHRRPRVERRRSPDRPKHRTFPLVLALIALAGLALWPWWCGDDVASGVCRRCCWLSRPCSLAAPGGQRCAAGGRRAEPARAVALARLSPSAALLLLVAATRVVITADDDSAHVAAPEHANRTCSWSSTAHRTWRSTTSAAAIGWTWRAPTSRR